MSALNGCANLARLPYPWVTRVKSGSALSLTDEVRRSSIRSCVVIISFEQPIAPCATDQLVRTDERAVRIAS